MGLPNPNTTFSDLSNQKDSVADPRPSPDVGLMAGNLINQNNVAEGPTIPPLQQGEFRVPRPGAFGVASITNAKPMGSLIVFTWEDIQSFGSVIGEYRILANFAYDNNATPVEVGSSEHSPCTVQVVSPTATSAVFYLRPYLANGQTLPLEQCPTCTVAIPDPVFQFRASPDTLYIDSTRPQGTSSSTSATFDASGTFTVPANVTSLTVECWGSGGSGGVGSLGAYGGGGGGGGAYASSTISPVTAGTVYNIYVASGGSLASTYFNNSLTVSAAPGGNGQDGEGTGTGGAGGAGGAAASSVGSTTTSGTNGSSHAAPDGGAGGAAAGAGGAGGAGGTGTGTGSPGVAPGGGGGGGGDQASSVSVGANGRVKITYTTTASGAIPGFGIVNDAGQIMSLTDRAILFLNPNGKVTAILGTTNTSNGSPGVVRVYDGTGAGGISSDGQRIQLDGNIGRGRFYGDVQVENGTAADNVILKPGTAATATGGAATLPGNPVGFLKINVGGTDMRIPYYAV